MSSRDWEFRIHDILRSIVEPLSPKGERFLLQGSLQ